MQTDEIQSALWSLHPPQTNRHPVPFLKSAIKRTMVPILKPGITAGSPLIESENLVQVCSEKPSSVCWSVPRSSRLHREKRVCRLPQVSILRPGIPATTAHCIVDIRESLPRPFKRSSTGRFEACPCKPAPGGHLPSLAQHQKLSLLFVTHCIKLPRNSAQ